VKKEIIICRCQDITEQDVIDAIKKYEVLSVNEIKKITRAGMGHCQGKTCRKLIEMIIRKETGELIDDKPVFRPPSKSIPLYQVEESEEPFHEVIKRGRGGHSD